MKEIWKAIEGFEGLYEVSSIGRVRSLDRVVDYPDRKVRKTGRMLRLGKMHHGYRNAQLWKNAKCINMRVHRLVYEAFMGPIKDGHVIDHINNDVSDNRIENLRQVTYRENSANNQVKKSSNYLGVSWVNKYSKWSAWIFIDGRNRFLGYYNDEIEASKAYRLARRELLSQKAS